MPILEFAGTALKNLFSKPATKNYPAEPAVYPERSRGHIEIEIDACISCGMCVRNCPSSALTVDKNEGTWEINRFDCVACGYCVQVCPKKCLSMVPGYQAPDHEKFTALYKKSPEVMAAEAAKKKAALEAAAKAKAAREAAAKAKAAEAAKADEA